MKLLHLFFLLNLFQFLFYTYTSSVSRVRQLLLYFKRKCKGEIWRSNVYISNAMGTFVYYRYFSIQLILWVLNVKQNRRLWSYKHRNEFSTVIGWVGILFLGLVFLYIIFEIVWIKVKKGIKILLIRDFESFNKF